MEHFLSREELQIPAKSYLDVAEGPEQTEESHFMHASKRLEALV